MVRRQSMPVFIVHWGDEDKPTREVEKELWGYRE